LDERYKLDKSPTILEILTPVLRMRGEIKAVENLKPIGLSKILKEVQFVVLPCSSCMTLPRLYKIGAVITL
jgi:hypothetical protein